MADEQNQSLLADALIKSDAISREDLAAAQAREKRTGVPWYRTLLQMGTLSYETLDQTLRYEFHSQSKRTEDESLGRMLVNIKAITEEQLKEALKEQARTGKLLGKILLAKGVVTSHAIAIALSKQHSIEFTQLAESPSDRHALESVPESLALRHRMIPVSLDGDRLTVLIADPQQRNTLSDLAVILGKRVHAILTSCDDIKGEIKARYAGTRNVAGKAPAKQQAPPPVEPPSTGKKAPKESAASKAKQSKEAAKHEENKSVATVDESKDTKRRFDEIAKQAEGAPVIKLVSTIIEGAVNSGATDIHLDPQEPEMRVRYRIDGILHDVMSIAPDIEPAVISRIKIMSDLDITETRRPQDGHISIETKDREFDVRVATLPTFLGERVVLRMLDQSTVLSGIKDLGLDPDDEAVLIRTINQPYGMILVTGPTGSGKTTTLYAALNQKNALTESIVTLEDPVEYQMSGINQVQIDADIEMTFAATLRAALRQDIDVLLVGEIRDADTARIAIRAAMTGHLVFSTLHTNDAPEAISTLRNMQVPSYLISSALTCVVAQRLVRKICPDCREAFTPTKALLKSLRLPETTKKLYRGKGCDSCYHTGNKGRTGIFEIIEITDSIRKMIAEDVPTEQIVKAAKLKTMADRCRSKVKDGVVAPEEFLRVIRT
ncbi:MAG: Flp pilus assembly complex ATPase component TadA [Candidatus Hydrogenedentes bacterium]|nr:Flp pilus assembly complex ATPase component TadA [Candidatus Hydrogenedentota bacterium]